jgi:uncharacterized membrane protein
MDTTGHLSPSDERLFAGLSYLFGLVVALLIWGTQKDRSRFVRFHALQAIWLDAFFILASVVLSGCLVVSVFTLISLIVAGIIAVGATANPQSPTFLLALILPMGLPALIVFPVFVLIGAALFARIVAAVKALQGQDFCLPLIGKRIEERLPVG